MTIKKKLEKVIEKGGHVAADLKQDKTFSNFNLRLPNELGREIDEALQSLFGVTKTAFILQAIQEKLRRINEVQ